MVDQAGSEYVVGHADETVSGIERARSVLAWGDAAIAAYLLHEPVEAIEQVLDLVVAIATIHGDTTYLEPILQTALDGLRRPTLSPRRTSGAAKCSLPLCRQGSDRAVTSPSDARRQ